MQRWGAADAQTARSLTRRLPCHTHTRDQLGASLRGSHLHRCVRCAVLRWILAWHCWVAARYSGVWRHNGMPLTPGHTVSRCVRLRRATAEPPLDRRVHVHVLFSVHVCVCMYACCGTRAGAMLTGGEGAVSSAVETVELSWLQRVTTSAATAGFGVALVGGAVALLWWNERRSSGRTFALKSVAARVEEGGADAAAAAEGTVVHVTGETVVATNAAASDDMFPTLTRCGRVAARPCWRVAGRTLTESVREGSGAVLRHLLRCCRRCCCGVCCDFTWKLMSLPLLQPLLLAVVVLVVCVVHCCCS